MMRDVPKIIAIAMQFMFASFLGAQSDLENEITEFLRADTVEIGRAVPSSLNGRNDEARRIVREKLETETTGLAFLQLRSIAHALGDRELERSVFRKACDLLIRQGLDPLSEGLIIEGFLEIAIRSDVDLLTEVIESKNLKLQNSKKFIENRIGKIGASDERDASTIDGTAVDPGAEESSSQRGKEGVLAQKQKPKFFLVIGAIAMLGISILLIRALLRGRAV